MSKITFILVVITLSVARSQSWTGPNQLQPVHGLYVKPSSDGTTGDLYVAASEDSGKAQWLTDQPVNFLPAATSSQATEERSSPQKRTVISSSPSVQYAYAVPYNLNEASPYSYVLPSSSPTPEASSQCEKTTASAADPYNAFHLFYPQIMAAYANAKNVLKDSGMSDEKAASVVPQASPFWPSGYSYPPYPMYVMVDPPTWAQLQSAKTFSSTTTESPHK